MIKHIISSKLIQKILAKIHLQILRGMNYANNGDYKDSGELFILNYIYKNNDWNLPVVFDVGANKGGYTLAIHKVFKGNVSIHAFEPSVNTYQMFKNNTVGITNLIANNLGIGDEESTLVLYSNSEGSGLASVYDRKIGHYGIKLGQLEQIKITTVDLYCKEQNIKEVLLLKLDIEGHEFNAIKGARYSIEQGRIKYIQFECGGTNIDSRTYFKDFYDFLIPRYRIFRILKKGMFEIKNYTEQNEVFLNVNYLAILR